MLEEQFYIERITHHMAMEVVVANHYLHRKAPCSWAFGMFDKSNHQLVGVVIYGVYDSTNYATLSNYTASFALKDTLWGGILFASVTYLTYQLNKFI
jgi:uncharacterized membrane protein